MFIQHCQCCIDHAIMTGFQSLHLLFGTDGTFFGQEEVVEKKKLYKQYFSTVKYSRGHQRSLKLTKSHNTLRLLYSKVIQSFLVIQFSSVV